MASSTQSNKITWRIAAYFTTFEMMYMQLDCFLRSGMCSTTLASVVVTLQDILTDIVFVVHLAKLIVCSYRKRLSFKHCLQALCVKFCGFHSYKSDRQNPADTLDNGNMFLNLYFYWRSKPSFMLAVNAVIESRRTVTGLAVASWTTALPACR